MMKRVCIKFPCTASREAIGFDNHSHHQKRISKCSSGNKPLSLYEIMAKRALEYPLPFRILRLAMPLLERSLPSLAGRIAIRLFLSPIKFGFTKGEKEAMDSFRMYERELRGRKIMVYEKGEGREVICVHGWSGRAMQFMVMADAIVASGFKCVTFDGPAHGLSTGRSTTLFEFASVFEAILQVAKAPLAVVGHSLGAAAISYAISQGRSVPAFASFGAPVVGEDILDEFARRINGSAFVKLKIREKAIRQFGKTFDEVTMQHTFRKVSCPVIAFHGSDDMDVPVAHIEVLKAINPQMEAHVLPGMGHRWILKDEGVLLTFTRWLKGLA